MEEVTILKAGAENSASLFTAVLGWLDLIYQTNDFKTKKMNFLGWHKSYIAYMTATLPHGNKFIGTNLVCTQS